MMLSEMRSLIIKEPLRKHQIKLIVEIGEPVNRTHIVRGEAVAVDKWKSGIWVAQVKCNNEVGKWYFGSDENAVELIR